MLYLIYKKSKKKNKGLVRFLSARRYHIDNSVQLFSSFELEVLPLMADLLGNDYTAKDVFQSFYVSIKS